MEKPASVPDEPARQPSLRERKFARTKQALLNAAVEGLRSKRLEEITVKELCEAAEVSEATFFNYFARKEDLLAYFIQLWIIQMSYRAQTATGTDGGLAFIDSVFEHAAQRLQEHPRMIMEIIAYMAQQPHPQRCPKQREWPDLTLAERLQAFPDCRGIECLPELCLEDLFGPALDRAIQRGELTSTVDREATLLALLSTFLGVPLWLGVERPERLGAAYRRQLNLLWAGLRALRS
jgi:AcrR family transcriptional regulator